MSKNQPSIDMYANKLSVFSVRIKSRSVGGGGGGGGGFVLYTVQGGFNF